MLDKLYGFITSKSMGWAFDKIGGLRSKKKLQKEIREYISNYYVRVFYDLSHDEEFDFEGLNEYLTCQFDRKINLLFNAPDSSIRKKAREQLFTESYDCANATTPNQKLAVYHYLTAFLNIVEMHFLDQIDDAQWFLGGHTLDEMQGYLSAEIKLLASQLTEQIDYRGSFAEMIDYMEQEISNDYQFHYRNDNLRFHGRQTEMEALRNFLEDKRKITIAIICGPGGVGKSKLVYHFLQKYQYDFSWKMLFVTRQDLRSFLQFHEWKYPKKLLLVFDYAGFMSKEIGEWILALSKRVPTALPIQLKIVLIERQGFSFDRSGQPIEPYWYLQLLGLGQQECVIKNYLFENDVFSPFLQLSGLQRSDLYGIIDDYAGTYKKKLNLIQKEKIVRYVEKIEENDTDSRPLILLLATDAYLNEKTLGNWRITDLMTNILERYKYTWLNTLCDQDHNLYNDLEYILVYATALDGWNIQNIEGVFRHSSEHLLSLNGRRLIDLVCGVNNSTVYKHYIAPLKPDLIGEFFVLEFLWENSVSREKLRAIVNELWKGDAFPAFLLRCISDYALEPHYKELFENGMNLLLPEAFTYHQGAVISLLLKFLCGIQEELDCEETVKWLWWLEKTCHSKITLEAYAQGIFMLITKEVEKLERAKGHIEILASLHKTHPNNEMLINIYAKALRWVINECDSTEAIELIRKFENDLFHSDTVQNAEMKLEYAKAILGMLQWHELDLGLVKKKLSQLEKLCKDCNDSKLWDIYCYALLCTVHFFGFSVSENHNLLAIKEVALQSDTGERNFLYTHSLICLLNRCENEQLAEILHEFEDWASDTGDQEILALYIISVFQHISSFDSGYATTLLKRIGELVEKHKGSSSVILSYASGLLMLYANNENPDPENDILMSIQKLVEKYRNVQTLRFSLEAILHQAEVLKSLRTGDKTQIQKSPWDTAIPNSYGGFLINLDQNLLQKLINEYDIYQPNFTEKDLELIEQQMKNTSTPEYRMVYAMATVVIMNHSDNDTSLSLLSKLRSYVDLYSTEQGMVFLYFEALIMLFAKTNFRTKSFLENEIREFAEEHKEEPNIAMLYCTLLSMQLLFEEGEGAEDIFEKIQEICYLHKDFPGFSDLVILALGIFTSKGEQDLNLILPDAFISDKSHFLFPMTASVAAMEILEAMEDQQPDEKLSSLRKLSNFAKQYSEDDTIAKIIAAGFHEVSIDIKAELNDLELIQQLGMLVELHGTQKEVYEILNETFHNFLANESRNKINDIVFFPLLEKLYEKNQDVLDIIEEYAQWLYFLFIEGNTENIHGAEAKLKTLLDRFPDSEVIVLLYNYMVVRDYEYLVQTCQSIAEEPPFIAKEELQKLSALFPLRSETAWRQLSGTAFEAYSNGKQIEAEILFYAASLADTRNMTNLAYMARRGECRLFTVNDAKKILSTESSDPFALINYALLLAINDHQWANANRYMQKLQNQDLSAAIDWWEQLHEQGDPEGTLVMAWLSVLGLIRKRDNISFSKLKQVYFPDLPDWFAE